MYKKLSGVYAKKFFGQHFLNDDDTAKRIANTLPDSILFNHLLEIGPGTGVLTKHLIDNHKHFSVIEIDRESIAFLRTLFQSTANYQTI